MLRNARYLHYISPYSNAHFRGFSLYYFQTDDATQVNYYVTFCSKKDAFSRRTAREELALQGEDKLHTCRVVDFPMEVAKLSAKCDAWSGDSKWLDDAPMGTRRQVANRFAWLWKYFL